MFCWKWKRAEKVITASWILSSSPSQPLALLAQEVQTKDEGSLWRPPCPAHGAGLPGPGKKRGPLVGLGKGGGRRILRAGKVALQGGPALRQGGRRHHRTDGPGPGPGPRPRARGFRPQGLEAVEWAGKEIPEHAAGDRPRLRGPGHVGFQELQGNEEGLRLPFVP